MRSASYATSWRRYEAGATENCDVALRMSYSKLLFRQHVSDASNNVRSGEGGEHTMMMCSGCDGKTERRSVLWAVVGVGG
jgi:hypothetical protein